MEPFTCESHASLCQSIDVGRSYFAAVATYIRKAHVVGKDDQKVGSFRHLVGQVESSDVSSIFGAVGYPSVGRFEVVLSSFIFADAATSRLFPSLARGDLRDLRDRRDPVDPRQPHNLRDPTVT